MQKIFKSVGNLISENKPITKEFLDFCLEQNVKISLKNGDFSENLKPTRQKYNEDLLNQVATLYLNGRCYPKQYSTVFMFRHHFDFSALLKRFLKDDYVKVVKLYKDDVTEQIKETMLDRYGVENAAHSIQLQEKSKKTMLERYGVENPMMCQEIRDVAKQTNLERYGVENVFQSEEIKEKIKQTNLERYGVENPSQSKLIRGRVSTTVLEKFGVENVFQSEEIKEKIKQTNLERYGVEYSLSSTEIREKCKQTLLKRYGVENAKQFPEFIEKAIQSAEKTRVLNDPRFAQLVEYRKLLTVNSSPELNLEVSQWLKENYPQTTADYYLVSLGLRERKRSSLEHLVQSFLETLGVDFIQNNRTVLGGLEMDFYCPEQKVGIECNGVYWHSDLFKYRNYHQDKKNLATLNGISLMMFTEDEITEKFEIVKSIIRHRLGLTDVKIPARSCKVVKLNEKEVSTFLRQNHLNGFAKADLNLGLLFNDEIVQVMTFSISGDNFEIVRFCSKLNTLVQGGVSKLLKNFKRSLKHLSEPIYIKTFVNANTFDANIFSEIDGSENFETVSISNTEPDSWFVFRGKLLPKDIKVEHSDEIVEYNGCGNFEVFIKV